MPLGFIVARALHFWSVAILFGGGGFLILVGAARVGPGRLVLRMASLAAAFSGAAWFAFTFASVTGGTDGFVQQQSWIDFLTSPFGPPWVVQIALDAGAFGLCVRPRPVLCVGVGAALAIDQAWLGHAAAGTGALGATMIASYVAHVLAGFVWVGALTVLCMTLRSPDVARDGLALFSTLGLALVATILASGCLNAAVHLNRMSDLAATPYGRLILAKTALFAAMLMLAVFNRRERRNDRIATRSVALGVGLETALGILVLCAAAALGITEPSG